MPSGADLEYQRLLRKSGQSDFTGLDGARLSQLEDENDSYSPKRLATDAGRAAYGGLGFSGGPSTAIGVGLGGRVYMVQGLGNGTLRRTADLGATTASLTTPTNCNASSCQQIIEWNGYVYGIFTDTTDSISKVYRAPITTGSTALTWSSSLFSLTAGATSFGCTMTATSGALLVGEYGDPLITAVKTAHIFRTTDGTNFTTVKTYGSAVRHVHCVAADPYNDGQVWASFGDSVPNCYSFSSDHGATWTDIACGAGWQGVQISFSKDLVYVAPDASSPFGSLFVFDRLTKTPRLGTVDSHRNMIIESPGTYVNGKTTNASTTFTTDVPDFVGVFTANDVGRKITGAGIPAGTTIASYVSGGNVTLSAAATATASNVTFTVERPERPKSAAFLGVVDPATGIYYGVTNNDPGGGSNTTGRLVLFMVPYVGGPVIRISETMVYGSSVLIDSAGNLWYGHAYRQLIAGSYGI